MKKIEWYKAMSLADEKYISEANPDKKIIPFKRKKRITSVLAACACLLLVLCNLWLFMPFDTTPPEVTGQEESAYYDIIQKLNAATWKAPEHNNNFENIVDEVGGVFGGILDGGLKGDAMNGDIQRPGAALGTTGTLDLGETSGYQEVTDNQVEGIIEADRIKRTDKNIYYLDEQTLRVFSIAGLESAELGSFKLLASPRYYMEKWEFYLSQDGNTAVVITQYLNEEKETCVGVVALDVSDSANITEKNRVEIAGNYLSSRLTGGELLLISQFVVNTDDLDFSDETTFLPQINSGNGFQSIPAEDIVSPETLSSTRYTVIVKLDENTLESHGAMAYLSYSEDVYVSAEHIFLTHVFADFGADEEGNNIRNAMTEISCLSYKNDLEQKGSVTVRGYVKDQWSMDEYENILRVVTTTNATITGQTSNSRDQAVSGGNVSMDVLVTATGNANASLYCVDLGNFEIVSSVIDFAPPGEEVQSVRFDKETAYVCTSVEMSDPVFFFDLSDLNNITYKDTGTIEGFSTSLVNFGDGYLLGIGRESWDTFKAEIYTETDTGVEGLCAYTIDGADYATEYKSYYIDRENQLLGLGIVTFKNAEDGANDRYILLHFDGYNLIELVNTPLMGDNLYKRSVCVDGYLYMFGRNDFKVVKVF